MITVANIGFAIGKTIRRHSLMIPQPSIIAASSISPGKPLKKPVSSRISNANVVAASGRISAILVFISPNNMVIL